MNEMYGWVWQSPLCTLPHFNSLSLAIGMKQNITHPLVGTEKRNPTNSLFFPLSPFGAQHPCWHTASCPPPFGAHIGLECDSNTICNDPSLLLTKLLKHICWGEVFTPLNASFSYPPIWDLAFNTNIYILQKKTTCCRLIFSSNCSFWKESSMINLF